MSDLIYAKAFLQQGSSESKLNVYDHLTALIHKILVEQPVNAVDYIEEYSRKVKEEYFQQLDVFQDEYQPPFNLDFATNYSRLLQIPSLREPKAVVEDEENAESPMPNLLENFYYLEQAGVTFPKHELFCLGLSIKAFAETLNDYEKIRYWGKVFGREKNYYILEVKFPAEEYEEGEDEVEMAPEESEEKNETVEPEMETRPDISSIEKTGIFANIKVPPFPKVPESKTVEAYYVCNDPAEPWIRLPDVKPGHITAARNIKVAFTGNLNSEVTTYPPFPGNEMEYLRAQISRISASTQISPLEYYIFDEDEDYEDENERSQIMKNEEYEPLTLTDLVDPSMAFWVHHSQHILQQGRTHWWNPKENAEEDQVSEESEEEDEEEEEEPEVGPPLLTPLSEDTTTEFIAPWSATLSSKLDVDNAFAVIRSNIWPGAIAYCTSGPQQKFENFYVGWGHKYSAHSFTPPPMPPIQFEYALGPEVMEVMDPSTVEEREVWLAKERRRKNYLTTNEFLEIKERKNG
ncbi:radial spoke head protein 4 homolog A [Hetaerina americana]|uniref:radial spoke head protein 4 homolog A n=1 Tax=Hetaerina americana TaxID=62018 RepID=UPI003A7F3027